MLRQFLYLDHALVRDFLSQVEGGVFDESRELSSSERRRGIEGRAGVGPVSAGANRTKGDHSESEAVVRQTATSEFDRLYGHLEADGLRVHDVIDAAPEELEIKRKEIIEVDARLRVSGIHGVMDLIRQFTNAMPLMQQLGKADQPDAETMAGLQAMTALGDGTSSTSLIGLVPGAAGLSLALDLQADGMRASDWDTDATVLMKIQRILRSGESQVVGDPFGGLMQALPAEIQQQFATAVQSDELQQFGIGGSEVIYPGIIGTPIAIYR